MVLTPDSYQPVVVAVAGLAAMTPSLIAKDILSVQPMTAPTGSIFSLRYRYDPFHKVRPAADSWFTGYSDNRTLMHPFKYGDKYLDGDTYFYKIKLRGL